MDKKPEKKGTAPKPDAYEYNGSQVGCTLDERCDKPGVRGHGAARVESMKYKDE